MTNIQDVLNYARTNCQGLSRDETIAKCKGEFGDSFNETEIAKALDKAIQEPNDARTSDGTSNPTVDWSSDTSDMSTGVKIILGGLLAIGIGTMLRDIGHSQGARSAGETFRNIGHDSVLGRTIHGIGGLFKGNSNGTSTIGNFGKGVGKFFGGIGKSIGGIFR